VRRRERWSPLLVVALSAVAACGAGPAATGGQQPDEQAGDPARAGVLAEVDHVIDGDTIAVELGGRAETVRFIGIDAPEKPGGLRPEECYGAEATERLRALLPEGSSVRLLGDEESYDRYDRLLGYVYRAGDDLFLNLDLVRGGYAAAFRYEPNTWFADELGAAERDARRDGAGLWGTCGGPDVEVGGGTGR
jgi:micrococcal nuclease